MPPIGPVVLYNGSLRAVLRVVDDFGFVAADLTAPPRRLLGSTNSIQLYEPAVDVRRLEPVATPAVIFRQIPNEENWLSVSQRTMARLFGTFLIAEDPQRRLDALKAATLMHQTSLVQHVLERAELRKVLIADEVGLGKTIEAALIVQRLLETRPNLRILYLAPARLVSNVAFEFRDKVGLDARTWVAGTASDARLDHDRLVIASIHKAVFGNNLPTVIESGPWDVLIVDECHHLSDWGWNGGKPNQSFKLVSQLIQGQPPDGRLILMSGTPHQGSEIRFRNILRLLSDDPQKLDTAAGRVIFRTKDRVRDWNGKPLFPARDVRKPRVVALGPDYERWYGSIARLYEGANRSDARARASGWAKGQALQWAASSVHAGLGFLVRLAMRRRKWTLENEPLALALATLRPYRGGRRDEPLDSLFARLQKQIGAQILEEDVLGDDEEIENEEWRPDEVLLSRLLKDGASLARSPAANAKWSALVDIIDAAQDERVLLFAQPVETVTVVAEFLEKHYGQRPSIIIGNQSDEERRLEVNEFQRDGGRRFLVSSRAGGEGLNMQRARRLIHLDVPWNPMELEQRIGRIHRFGSRKTVIIETVVAEGSREIDMYRIAREKLRTIARQLDPDPQQFELLFSRVMSLIPPKEVEDLLSETSSSVFSESQSNEIGDLVAEGHRSWSSFDETYRSNAEKIRSSVRGEATWADLGFFLTKYGGAKFGDETSVSSFTFENGEIVAGEQQLPTLRLNDSLYAMGDTGGLPAEEVNGEPVKQLGLNIPEVVEVCVMQFSPMDFLVPAILADPRVQQICRLLRLGYYISSGKPSGLRRTNLRARNNSSFIVTKSIVLEGAKNSDRRKPLLS